MTRYKLQLHRWVVHITRGHDRKRDLDGIVARRLLEGLSSPPADFNQWLEDLRYMVALAWAVSPDGNRYLSSLRAQGAALNLRRLLDTIDANAFKDRIRKERAGA